MSWTIERRGRVAVVTMTTNPVNAQNQAFFADLHDAFDRLERDHRDSPVVLTGTGRRFSAGLDLDERLGRGAGRSRPGMGRDRDRGIRAGVLREPVRVDGPVVRALRRLAVGWPRSAGRSTGTPKITSRPCWHWALSSKREITRTRIRVRTAMAAQTREQGRYLGGRPPYGYRLGDAGPHPNKAHAAWGRRAHRLEPDPATAPVVRVDVRPAAGRAQRGADHPGAE